MTTILIGIHVLVCFFLIFVVLLQSAQAADLAGAFGGGGSQTALGMRGAATMLQKATTGAAVLFMLTSLALGMVGRSESSLIEGIEDPNVPAAVSPEGAVEEGVEQGAAGEEQDEGGDEQSGAGADDGGGTDG